MFNKVDVRSIVKGHLGTLVHAETKRVLPEDIILFFGVPAVLAVGAVLRDGTISTSLAAVLATVHAIISGLMFNLLVVIYDVHDRAKKTGGDAARNTRMLLLNETYRNVSFLILTSIAALVLLAVAVFVGQGVFGRIVSGLVYFLSGVFALTLLMVLKRTHALLSEDFSQAVEASRLTDVYFTYIRGVPVEGPYAGAGGSDFWGDGGVARWRSRAVEALKEKALMQSIDLQDPWAIDWLGRHWAS